MVWEERWHPLREEWVIVAAHRQDRPWSGETVKHENGPRAPYVEDCYLCPGNARVNGAVNPQYTGIFVFDNDHPCVGLEAPTPPVIGSGVYRNRSAQGIARVVCYSPRHDLSLAQLKICEIEKLITAWQREYVDLGGRPEIDHVLIFENKGEAVGVSNPHPHCQIYATNFVFKTIETEVDASAAHWDRHGRSLFQDIIVAEEQDGRRLLSCRDGALAFVPYFARYPYETYVAPRATHGSIAGLEPAEVSELATVLQETLIRLENLWRMPLPYVMVLHQAPTKAPDDGRFHF